MLIDYGYTRQTTSVTHTSWMFEDSENYRERVISKWLTLHAKPFEENKTQQIYHFIKTLDYVISIAKDPGGFIPVVCQYRIPCDSVTLEFPAGLVESNESPQDAAVRELLEETGLEACSPPIHVTSLFPEPGRLRNRAHIYFFPKTYYSSVSCEGGLTVQLYSESHLPNLMLDNSFSNAVHHAAYLQASLRGYLSITSKNYL